MADPIKNTYFAYDKNCMENGSFFRFTGRKKQRRFAHYMQGDFVQFLNELPTGRPLETWAPKEGRKLLPHSMFC